MLPIPIFFFQEKKHLKKIAKSVTHKVEKVGGKVQDKLTNKKEDGSPGKSKDKDKLDNSLNRFSDPISKIKGAPSRGSPGSFGRQRSGRNLDPGVNSDDEEDNGGRLDDDDMFRFDALSHGSSGSSLNMSNKVDNIGIVSKTSTPLSGSFENLGGGEFLRKTGGTPVSSRRSFVPQESPLVNSTTVSKSVNPKVPTTEDMDEWELKLLGKKGVPYVSSPLATDDRPRGQRDNLSQISGMSINSGSQASSRTNTLERIKTNDFPQVSSIFHAAYFVIFINSSSKMHPELKRLTVKHVFKLLS